MITFNSGSEMLAKIMECDLYNAKKELYVFQYSENGSIAVYNINESKAYELRQMDGYWGGNLGVGGSIYDDPSNDCYDKEWSISNLDWCNDNYEGEWEDVTEENMYREAIVDKSNDNHVVYWCEDVVNEHELVKENPDWEIKLVKDPECFALR